MNRDLGFCPPVGAFMLAGEDAADALCPDVAELEYLLYGVDEFLDVLRRVGRQRRHLDEAENLARRLDELKVHVVCIINANANQPRFVGVSVSTPETFRTSDMNFK